MAKKYQRRTNIADRKKKEEAAKLKKRQDYYAAHKKSIWTIAIAAVIVIVAAVFALDYFVCPGGTIRNFLGKNVGVEDSWIVRNLGTTRHPSYYKFGEMGLPEGYVQDGNGGLSSDEQEQSFYFAPAEENGGLFKGIYVTGVKNKTGAEMLETVWAAGKPKEETDETAEEVQYLTYIDMTEPASAEWGGQEVGYVTYSMQQNDDNGNPVENMFNRNVIAYVDTVQGSSILINAMTDYAAPDELPADEAIIAEMETLLAQLKVAE